MEEDRILLGEEPGTATNNNSAHIRSEVLNISQHMAMQEAMSLDEMVCRSICAVDNSEIRKRLASQIILVGGVVKTDRFVETLEDQVFNKIR